MYSTTGGFLTSLVISASRSCDTVSCIQG
jgi:hypothetical protein